MSTKLRDLIQAVRQCRTVAEERAIIARESAEIRAAFRSGDESLRHRHVAKLLFIHLMGYPTHFGQMEAIRLVASDKFAEKRIGYLALMILLDEHQDILMMVTNTMKKDLSRAGDQDYVAGLALCALGNVASADMARELAKEVAGFFSCNKPFLRKKAALCALRFVRKVPDLVEEFLPAVGALVNARTHAVQLTGITLMVEMCRLAPEIAIAPLREHVPRLVQILRSLWVNADDEYDVNGVIDPFLQVRILQLIRELGRDHLETSKQVTDILATIILNTNKVEVSGCAVQYECAQTVFGIMAENGLRGLALNQLGRFLVNRSSNIRYVALNALCQLVHKDHQAVNEHRAVIIELLRDSDVPVRRKALDLIYALVNKSNAKNLVREMLNYFVIAPGEQQFKADLADKIYYLVDTYAPSCAWYIHTMIKVLAIAGPIAPEYIATDLLSLISRSEDQHRFAVYRLAEALGDAAIAEQPALANLALWVMGEYGHYLIKSADAQAANANEFKTNFTPYTEMNVIKLVGDVLEHKKTATTTRQIALNTLAKFTARFANPDDGSKLSETVVAELQRLFSLNLKSMNPELQQRSSEYLHISSRSEICGRIFARLPKFERPGKFGTLEAHEKNPPTPGPEASPSPKASQTETPTTTEAPKQESSYGVLERLFDTSAPAEVKQQVSQVTSVEDLFAIKPTQTTQTTPVNPIPNVFDIVSGVAQPTSPVNIFPMTMPGAVPGTIPATTMPVPMPMPIGVPMPGVVTPVQQVPAPVPDVTDLFARVAIVPTPQADPVVLDEKGLNIKLAFKYTSPRSVIVTVKYSNALSIDIRDVELSVSVPSYLKTQVKPISSRTIPAKSECQVTQDFICEAAKTPEKYVARIRVSCKINGEDFIQVAKVDCFPPVPPE